MIPILPAVAIAAFIRLLWTSWMTIELLLYSLSPFLLLYTFDGISITNKTLFIILGNLILTVGVAAYHRIGDGLMLVAAAVVGVVMASPAAVNFWEMARDLGYGLCVPDAHGCPFLAGRNQDTLLQPMSCVGNLNPSALRSDASANPPRRPR